MSNENMTSDLLVELPTEQQQLLSGGQRYPVICYDYEPYFRGGRGRGGRGGRGGGDVDVDVDVDVERRRRRGF
ncbi:MAG: hypothetical protein RLZZ507_1395 [Cyanobacteriota bacterium]|jgi:hypothetical protein